MRAADLKKLAIDLGFDLVGIASADDPMLMPAIDRYRAWLDAGYGASMKYLQRHLDFKAHPQKFLPGCKSVVSVALLYGAQTPPDDGSRAQVSIYTRGQDYHEVMGQRLAVMVAELGRAGIRAREFVDSEPVMDRFWAWRAGLGWLGKNTCLIHRRLGSMLFLGGMLVDAALEIDAPQPDHCGRCRKCIDACPTTAITEDRFIEAPKCIAYHTIENRGAVPESVMADSGRWVAGCDVCQTVCPWNDPVTLGSVFTELNPAFDAPLADLVHWSADEFKQRMRGIAMARMKYAGFLRNLAIAIANSDLDVAEKQEAFEALSARVQEFPDGAGRDVVMGALAWAGFLK